MKTISILIKPASGLCNINCKYCFYKDEMKNRLISSYGMMSIDTYQNILKRFLAIEGLESINIAFQGGEPLIRGLDFFKKIIEIEKKSNSKIKITHSIQTNGILLDDDWCHYFKENNFLVGVSLDGINSTHDINRISNNKEGTFKIVLNNIELLKKYNISFNILTVVTKDIVKNIDKIYSFYKENNFKFVQFIPCIEANQKFLLPHDYELFLDKLFNLYYKDMLKGNYQYNRYFENLIGIILNQRPEDCSLQGHCSLQYVIEANGNVYPCDFYAADEYLLGNINKNSLEEINYKCKDIKFIEKSYKINAKCLKCKYYKLCRGGCIRQRNTQQFKSYFCSSFYGFFEKNIKNLLAITKILEKKGL